MSLWYSIIDFLFPFEWAQYEFMKNALLGVLLVTPMFGILRSEEHTSELQSP